jgi:LacI family transcriptional regulator
MMGASKSFRIAEMSSLRVLAAELGLSVTTVSRALAGYSDVAESTMTRVREAADRVGYRPNATARRLRMGRTDAVAFVIPRRPEGPYEPLFVDLMAAVGERLADEGLDLVVVTERGDDPLGAYRHVVEDRRADAVVVVRTLQRDPRVAYLTGAGIPFVTFGRTEEPVPHAFLDGDGTEGFRAATEHLFKLGHRRIAHVGAAERYAFADYRLEGWRNAIDALGLQDNLVMTGEATPEAGHDIARRFLAGKDPPTALLCATDRMAFGAIRAVREAGLVPGRDVSVVGHDNLPSASYADPPLSTMEIAIAAAGARLAELVLERMGGKPPEALRELWRLSHIWRASTAPPP